MRSGCTGSQPLDGGGTALLAGAVGSPLLCTAWRLLTLMSPWCDMLGGQSVCEQCGVEQYAACLSWC